MIVWRVANPAIGGFAALVYSKLMRFSLLSDFLMLNRTRITISKFSDQSPADLFFLQDPCLQYEFYSDQECVSVKSERKVESCT